MRKLIRRVAWLALLVAMLITATLLVAAPRAEAQTALTATVNSEKLYLREGPSVGFVIVATLNKGETVTLLGRSSWGWLQVRTATGVVGWASASFLRTTAQLSTLPLVSDLVEPYAYINTGVLNTRTGPGRNYPIILTMDKWTVVSLVGKSADGDWWLVRRNGGLGWCHAAYITPTEGDRPLPVIDPATVTTPPPAGPVPYYGTGISMVTQNVYQGTATTSVVVASLPVGTRFFLTGRNGTSDWVQILLTNGVVGWVDAKAIGMSIFMEDLPVK